jgi:Ca-activated chloride channel homolog
MLEALNNFHFIRPLWLLLAVPVAGIWWSWQRSADPLRGWRAQMDPALLEALVNDPDRGARWRTLAPLIAWLLGVLIIAGPTWKPEPSPFAEDASSLVILLKADASMEKSDIAPSRLERARLKIVDLAEARKGQPLGLIAFLFGEEFSRFRQRELEMVARRRHHVRSNHGGHLSHDRGVPGRRQDEVS